MTLHIFTQRLLANGYARTEHPCFHSHYFTSNNKGIVIDNMRGGAYRLFLGLNCVPACYPADAGIVKRQIDAESPWFNYLEKTEKGDALNRCWQWLQTTGFLFLADPFSKDLYKWITEEKILIRDRGVIIPIPRTMRLP